jgi:DNA-binding transcriptional LysR family regulator
MQKLDASSHIRNTGMNLTALADFNLVAAEGGFGRASRRTGRPKATLSRRVRDLEEAFGVRLIERGGTGFRLTDEGATLHRRTADLLNEIEEAGQAIAEGLDRPQGLLRISAPVLFSHSEMGRLATDFRRRCPEVRIEAVAEDRFVDLVAEPFDLAIRINPHTIDGDLIGRCFMRGHLILVAPPELRPPSAGRTTRLPAVTLVAEPAGAIWRVSEGEWTGAVEPDPVMRLSSFLMVRDAVLAGAGVAVLPGTLAAAELATGQLKSWGVVAGRDVEVWVLHVSRRHISRKVRAFIDFLLEHVTEPAC